MTSLRPLHPSLHVPLTSLQRLNLMNRRRRPRPTPAPQTVVATTDSVPAGMDEVDAGYLGAILLQPRLVGLAAGQVPYSVAARLGAAGLVTLAGRGAS